MRQAASGPRKRDIACVVLRSADSHVLLVRKAPEASAVYADCWQIPGGGVEAGESAAAAACRELREETGVSVEEDELLKLSHLDSDLVAIEGCADLHLVFHTFLMEHKKPYAEISLSLGEELCEFRWVTKELLKELKFPPAGYRLFRFLGWLSEP